jgi:hypothetical protein
MEVSDKLHTSEALFPRKEPPVNFVSEATIVAKRKIPVSAIHCQVCNQSLY